MNELGINNYKSIANRVDILLCSKDNLSKINIELNKEYKSIIENKNNSYIYKLAGEYYAGAESKEKYKEEINVEQININGYLHKENKGVTISHSVVRDEEHDIIRKGIKFHDVYLPNIKKMCYDGCEEIYKDLAMFLSKDYEEMASIAASNREREGVMKDLKRLGSEEEFVDLYDHDEFEEILLQSYKDDAREAGLAEGRTAGMKEKEEEIINKLKKKGFSEAEIYELL